MFSGTSTGSILSAGLSLANSTSVEGEPQEPKYWADDIRNIYTGKRGVIFRSNPLNTLLSILVYVLYFLIFGIIFYFIGYFKYDNPKILKAQIEMLEFLQEFKNKLLEEKVEETKLQKMKTRLIVDKLHTRRNMSAHDSIEPEENTDEKELNDLVEEVDKEMTTYIKSKVSQAVKSTFKRALHSIQINDTDNEETLENLEYDTEDLDKEIDEEKALKS